MKKDADKEIQKYVDMIREKLTPLFASSDPEAREAVREVGTLLAAIDEVTGKEP